LNRKTKKRIKIVAVVLFFLIAGIGYFLWGNSATTKKEGTEPVGVLEAAATKMPEEYPVEIQSDNKTESEQRKLVVHVCGAVNEPGVYTLAPGSRLFEAIALAGGFSAEAALDYHNLARSISDGERIYILSVEEAEIFSIQQQVAGEEGAESGSAENGLVNLNTATVEQLMELPGIGESKAVGILEYRARVGQFTAIEEIRNVSGIGEAMYEKIKDKITVK